MPPNRRRRFPRLYLTFPFLFGLPTSIPISLLLLVLIAADIAIQTINHVLSGHYDNIGWLTVFGVQIPIPVPFRLVDLATITTTRTIRIGQMRLDLSAADVAAMVVLVVIVGWEMAPMVGEMWSRARRYLVGAQDRDQGRDRDRDRDRDDSRGAATTVDGPVGRIERVGLRRGTVVAVFVGLSVLIVAVSLLLLLLWHDGRGGGGIGKKRSGPWMMKRYGFWNRMTNSGWGWKSMLWSKPKTRSWGHWVSTLMGTWKRRVAAWLWSVIRIFTDEKEKATVAGTLDDEVGFWSWLVKRARDRLWQ